MTVDHDLYTDADLYDRIVAPPAESLDFYLAVAQGASGEVLELACGTGRLTVPLALALARDGRHVAGLDLAPAMLDAARRKAADAGVAIELTIGDMRRFALERRFGMIFVAFNSLLHLTTNDALRECFACVRTHLAPGGIFAFDIFNPSVRLLARLPDERSTVMRFLDAELGAIHVETTIDYDAATQVSRGAWIFSAPGRPDYLRVPLHLRSIFPQELPVLLAANQLELVERHGDFGREPFTSDSPRQVCICRATSTREA
ncbi:MAG TPA: class I SAM-dependent methyltransferase [Gemmatimonadaceae bacterium]|nr:class I SAM-dependent methyltransferase [Gemmatimonadaceae bacterium]